MLSRNKKQKALKETHFLNRNKINLREFFTTYTIDIGLNKKYFDNILSNNGTRTVRYKSPAL